MLTSVNCNTINRAPRTQRRRTASMTVELLLTLPIILIVTFAVVQFSMMLLASQAIGAAASAGIRESVLPGSSAASVDTTVANALQGWVFQNDCDVVIYVNNMPEAISPLANAITGDEVSVTVRVPAGKVAPNALLLVGISIANTDLETTFVMRKE